jgi:hypothetical protein
MNVLATKYKIFARIAPALLICIPVLLLYILFIKPYIQDFLPDISGFLTTEDITIGGAFLYLLIHVNRLVSKSLFQNESKFPTTELLLLNNKILPQQIKTKIRSKIQKLFEVDLFDQEEEAGNEEEARQVLGYAVAQIRDCTRDDAMIHRRNIEYGFTRNFLGGCIVAIVASFIGVALVLVKIGFVYSPPLTTFILTLSIYLLPILFHKKILSKMASYYQQTLFEQFLAKK